MYGYENWMDYMQRMHTLVEAQKQKIVSLEDRVTALEEQLQNHSTNERPSTNIEKIEYKFDQLKIETLEGTLNIGLSPQGLSGIDGLELPEKPMPPKANDFFPLKQEMIRDLNKYMSNEGPKQIDQIASQYGKNLDRSYQHFLIQDIQNQLENRVNHHIDKYKQKNKGVIDQQATQVITDNIKQEVNQSLHQFMQTEDGKEE